MSLRRTASASSLPRLLPSCCPAARYPSPGGFFVQEARRSGVCVTKMAQGRRPAFCCLSEECLLSGAGWWGWGGEDRRDRKVRSFFFEGADGQSLGTGAGEKFCSLLFFPLSLSRFIPADKDIDQVPAGRVLQVGSITRADVVFFFVLFCFITFRHVRAVEPQVLDVVLYSAASLFRFLPSTLPLPLPPSNCLVSLAAVGLAVLLTRFAEVCVAA